MSQYQIAGGARSRWLRWSLILSFIIWLTFILSSFFVVNKPVQPGLIENAANAWSSLGFSAAATARTLLDIVAALAIYVVALGLGLRIMRWLGFNDEDELSALVFGLALGSGTLGLLTLLLGLGGLLQQPLLYALVLILALVNAPLWLPLVRRLSRPRPPRLIGLYLLLVLGMALTLALLPPTSWDGLFYHLTGPKIYLQAGQIQPGLDLPHLNFPPIFDMLFLLGMGLRGDVTAKLLHFAFAPLLAGAVYLVATRNLKMERGWMAVVFLFATPLVPTLAAWAYNDLALCTFGLLAVHTYLNWREQRKERWLLLSGLFCGFMMGIKYTSFVTPLLLGFLVLWDLRHNWRHIPRPLLLFAAAAGILLLPWLAKNWLFTGNPVYPFVFGGRFWDAYRAAAYSDSGTGIGLDPVALLRLPYDMTLGYADASQEGTIGPFYLIFLPLLLLPGLVRRSDASGQAARVLLLYAAASYAVWTVGVVASRGLWQARLLLPGIVALCPLLAWTLADLRRFNHPQFSLQRFLRLAIVFTLLLLLLNQLGQWLTVNPVAYLSGNETRSSFLERRLGMHYVVMQEMNRELPQEAEVVFLWEPRSYYCEPDCHPDSILDRFLHYTQYYGFDAGELAAHWREAGYTHVLLYDTGLDFVVAEGIEPVQAEDLAVLEELKAHYLTPVSTWPESYSLYAIR
jgi:hypothetical protein